MKQIYAVILSFLLLEGVYSLPCDNTYYYKKATLITGRGDHVTNLSFTAQEIGGNFDIPVIADNPFYYRFPIEFKSQCPQLNVFPTEASYAIFAQRDSGSTEFFLTDTLERWNRFVALQTFTLPPPKNSMTVKNVVLMYPDTLVNAKDFVLADSTDHIYKATYGGAVYYDSLFSITTGLVGLGSGKSSWNVNFDTSIYMNDLRASSMKSTPKDNPNWDGPDYTSKRDFYVQMLVVEYDSVKATVPNEARLIHNQLPFHIKTTDLGFEITLSENPLPFYPTAVIYNIKGEPIKHLSMQGEKFLWDGSTQYGQASRGIYFLCMAGKFHKLLYNPKN